jgi:hypothetical protein
MNERWIKEIQKDIDEVKELIDWWYFDDNKELKKLINKKDRLYIERDLYNNK